MPLAALLLAVAYARRRGRRGGRHDPGVLLALHVALMLAGVRRLHARGGLAGLYLWHERRLKRREPGSCAFRVPALDALERLSVRTVAVSLAVLTLGIAFGGSSASSSTAAASTRRWRRRSSPGRSSPLLVLRAAAARASRRLRHARRASRSSSSSSRSPLRMTLVLVGISHHRAPVEVRERVALDAEQAAAVARGARRGGRRGRLPLDLQPHRALPRRADAAPRGGARRGGARRPRASDEVSPALYRLRDEAAALHLFRVAAGLDSMVPGEGEILGQVRAAFEAGAPGPVLDKLFRQALHAGKKVRARDRDRREPGVGVRPPPPRSRTRSSATSRAGGRARRRRQGRRADGAQPHLARRGDRVRRQPVARARRRARARARRRAARARRGAARAGARRRDRLLDERARLRPPPRRTSRAALPPAAAGRCS